MGVGHVQIVQRHVLNDGLLLVDVSLWDRDVFLRLQVELGGEGIGPAHPFDGPAVGLDVDDVAHGDSLPGQRVVDGGVELEGLAALGGFQAQYDVRDRSAVSSQRILGFFDRQFRHLPLVDFLPFLDPQSDGLSKVFHDDLGLFDLAREHLGRYHGAEREFVRLVRTDLLGQGHCQCGLARAGWTHQQQRPSRQSLGMHKIRDDAQSLPRRDLPDEPRGIQAGASLSPVLRHVHNGVSVLVQSQPGDVCVGGYPAARCGGGVDRGLRANRFYLDHG
mmetsp:Transcript_6623/g.19045  ORF Transcript_6623/g.19045 Transcript_6623/m.19045 type:complete len:276 (-) Transcript_6623:302-1129(-)